MKKWLFISLFFNALIIFGIAYLYFNLSSLLRPVIANFVKTHVEQKATMFEILPTKDSAIIFLGNSITEGANWDELFINERIINRGIGGDITQGILDRLDEIVRHQPVKVFIAIGTNDISLNIPVDTILSNIRSIIDWLQAGSPRTTIYVQSLLPVSIPPGSFMTHNNSGILEVNARLKDLCSEKNLTYIDLHPHFTDADGQLKAELSNDDLHLLGDGYVLWESLIRDYLEE